MISFIKELKEFKEDTETQHNEIKEEKSLGKINT